MLGYSFFDSIQNGFHLIYTKLFWKKARLVRRPIMVRNKRNFSYGTGFTCGTYCRINPGNDGELRIGDHFVMGDQCQIEAIQRVTIGNNVLLASRVYIGDASHGIYSGEEASSPNEPPNDRKIYTKPIDIGDNVWIGNGVSILGGVTIGNGCIIGAGAVVTGDIPDNCIAVGCPARVVKKYIDGEWKLINSAKETE